jgi:hypothetical protein
MSKVKSWLEPLHEAKNVALSVARWIPPTASSMTYDDDLALASSVLEAESRAFLAIKLPARRRLLQHHSAMHLLAQFLDFGGRVGSHPLLAFERRSWAVWPWACLRPCPTLKPRDRRAARARGTRGSLRRTLVARPALAVATFASHLRKDKVGANRKSAQKQGRSAAQEPLRDLLRKGPGAFPQRGWRSDRTLTLSREEPVFFVQDAETRSNPCASESGVAWRARKPVSSPAARAGSSKQRSWKRRITNGPPADES